jgi:hypothetical protein
MVVADFRRHFDGLRQLIEGMPVATVGDELIAVERGIIADDDAIIFRVQLHDVDGFRRGDAETFALADGVERDAVVLAEDVTVQVHDVAARFLHKVGLLQKAAVIVIRHEADFHALFLVGGLEIAMTRHFARIALGLFTERKNRARKLILSQREKKITLVFAQIASALEQIARAIRIFFDARKMSGRDEICAELIRAVNEPAELQILVAHHARIRRATGLVFIGEILDDVLLKFARLIDQIIWNVQLVADGARIGDGLRAAAFVLGAVHAILRPEFQRDADDVVTLLDQKRRRRRGINSSAHTADHALTLLRIHRRTLYKARAACKMVYEAKKNFIVGNLTVKIFGSQKYFRLSALK